MAAPSHQPGPISCEGAAFDDFRLTDHLPSEAAPGLDFASLAALEHAPSQGAVWEQGGRARKTFDRTHRVFTIWLPATGASDDLPALWPNSRPLPSPKP